MAKRDFLLSIIIGLAIFLTDFAFSWLTFLCGPIPVIFIIAIIIGIVAGSHGEAVIATMITWICGILLGMLLAPIILAEFWNPDQTLLGTFLIVFFYSVRGFFTLTYEGNIIEVIVVGVLYILVMLIVTPILYLVSFAFAPIGVVIGKFIRKRMGGRVPKQKPVPQQATVIPSTPVEEPTIKEEPFEEAVEEEAPEKEGQTDNTEF